MWNHYKQAVLSVLLLTALTVQASAQEADLLAVLKSSASVQEKSTACRLLALVATKDAVPVLAGLLADEKLSHMARYALETIQDPSADEALRQALGTVQGTPRLGVIGSLGARRDTQAVDALAAILKGADADAAQSAARALGCIGAKSAADALLGVLAEAQGAQQLAVSEGLLRCAESLTASGDTNSSQAVYDQLRSLSAAPAQVRAAALRGAILVRGKEGAPMLAEALLGSDNALAAAAARTAMEMPGAETSAALVEALAKAPAERKGLLIQTLADLGEPQVLPAVLEAIKSSDDSLRVLAFRTLKRVGNASCLPALLEAATSEDGQAAAAALEALEVLQDKSIDQNLVEQLSTAKGKTRLVILDLVKRRHAAAAAPAVWQAVEDTDPAVRAAALAALGAVLEPKDLPRLIARLGSAKEDVEATALDAALTDVCLRAADKEAVATLLADALPKAAGPVKVRVLTSLGNIGGAKALQTVAAAARSNKKEERDAAYRALGEWGSADAAPVLFELHEGVTDENLKSRAIKAYIRIARQFDMPPADRVAMCRKALEAAQRDADKRLVLEVLLRYPSDDMQAIALEATKFAGLKDEASLVLLGMASEGINRAELGKALAQAGHKPVKLEIVQAIYGTGNQTKDVTENLRQYAKGYRIIFLPGANYNSAFGGDPAPGIAKQLKVRYTIDGKEGEVSLNENAPVVLPLPK